MARKPSSDETRVVVSDVHGNHPLLRELLECAGAIDSSGQRVDGYWTAQVGDLLHLGSDVYEADLDTLKLGLEWLDAILIGNHELPFATSMQGMGFAGMHSELDLQLGRLLPRSVADERMTAAADVDGWLLTHAGLCPSLWRAPSVSKEIRDQLFGAVEPCLGSAEALAEMINERFIERLTSKQEDPLFDWIGRERDGKDPVGGIFWGDIAPLEKSCKRYGSPCPQIIGHTPRTGKKRSQPRLIELTGGDIWATDLAGVETGHIAALVKAPGESWEPLAIKRRKRPPSRLR